MSFYTQLSISSENCASSDHWTDERKDWRVKNLVAYRVSWTSQNRKLDKPIQYCMGSISPLPLLHFSWVFHIPGRWSSPNDMMSSVKYLQCSRNRRAAASQTSAWREAMMAVERTPSMQAARTRLQCWGTLLLRGLCLANNSDSSSASLGSSGGSNAFLAIYKHPHQSFITGLREIRNTKSIQIPKGKSQQRMLRTMLGARTNRMLCWFVRIIKELLYPAWSHIQSNVSASWSYCNHWFFCFSNAATIIPQKRILLPEEFHHWRFRLHEKLPLLAKGSKSASFLSLPSQESERESLIMRE